MIRIGSLAGTHSEGFALIISNDGTKPTKEETVPTPDE